MHKQGFFYVINHGLEQSQARTLVPLVSVHLQTIQLLTSRLPTLSCLGQTQRIFDAAAVPFRDVPPEEMKSYEADIKGRGEYWGYKPQQYWVLSFYVNSPFQLNVHFCDG